MKPLNPKLFGAAVVVIGALGFVIGRISPAAPAATEAAAGPTTTRASRSGNSPANASATAANKSANRPAASQSGSAKDRRSRLEAIVRGENPLDRNRALIAFIDQLAPGDFQQVIEQFREFGLTEQRMGEYALLLTAWADADPEAALKYAKNSTDDRFATDTVLTSWASKDPAAAIRWAKVNFSGEGANPYLAGIIRGIVETDPTHATELLASMPRSEERAVALDAMMPHLLRQGNEATRAWIDNLKDPALKNGAMIRAGAAFADKDPAGTVAWLIKAPGDAAASSMEIIYGNWAKTNQAAALQSYGTLPAGDIRSNALRGVIGNAIATSPKSAVPILDAYPNDLNDRTMRNFVWRSFNADPTTAVSQIYRIKNEAQRDRMYSRMVGSWIDSDPTAARAWMNANPLPAAVQADLNGRQAP
jgi:hypothetical protein